jgi:aldehyde:ferredoxin oxidoreductase
MAGFEGRMLDINLTNSAIETNKVDKHLLRQYIGGSGLAAKLFFDRVSPDVDPLSPENILFILTGPLSATNIPGGSRFSVCAKSPLTNIWGESCCGGDFAHELRSAGYDGIAIEGASSKPVYILIEDDKVEIKDASDLWGKDNYEVTDLLIERFGGRKKVKVLVIGQAGENLVRYAAIANKKRDFAGRCGMGAVMGSKKLKAIVVRGTGSINLASPTQFDERRKAIIAKAKAHPAVQVLRALGTNANLDVGMVIGNLPAKNWSLGDNTAVASGIGGPVLSGEKFLTRADSCRGCLVGCKREVHITEGPYKGLAGPGPEYEAVASLGSLLMIGDIAAVIKLNESCSRYGLDVISCGGTLAMAIECFENGLIGLNDTGGIRLRWGDADAVLKMIDKIAHRDGFGDVLAEGSKRAAQRIGRNALDYAVEVKGLEVPMNDPRGGHAFGLSYATGIRGACHTNDFVSSLLEGTGTMDWPEIGLKTDIPRQKSEGIAERIKISQDLGQIHNSAVLCYMLFNVINEEDLVDLMRAASGFSYDMKELMECGERIWNLKRGIGNLMGITAADDRLPKKLLTPTTEGPAAGSVPNIELMLKEYYKARGLDANGRPLKEKLNTLGLSDLAARLYK